MRKIRRLGTMRVASLRFAIAQPRTPCVSRPMRLGSIRNVSAKWQEVSGNLPCILAKKRVRRVFTKIAWVICRAFSGILGLWGEKHEKPGKWAKMGVFGQNRQNRGFWKVGFFGEKSRKKPNLTGIVTRQE